MARLSIRHEATLTGLPPELRLKIYEYLVGGQCQFDLTAMPIDHLYNPREHASADHRTSFLGHTSSITSSYCWIYTCRQMFEEGKWEVLKTHIISIRSCKQFSHARYSPVLRSARFLGFDDMHLQAWALRHVKCKDTSLAPAWEKSYCRARYGWIQYM